MRAIVLRCCTFLTSVLYFHSDFLCQSGSYYKRTKIVFFKSNINFSSLLNYSPFLYLFLNSVSRDDKHPPLQISILLNISESLLAL